MKLGKAIISLTIAMLLVPQVTSAQDKLKENNKPAATDQQNNSDTKELVPLLKLFEGLNDEKYFEKPLSKEAKDRILKAVETPENKWVIKFVQDMESRGIGLVPALYVMKTISDTLYQGDIIAWVEGVNRDMSRYLAEENLRIYERANGTAKDKKTLEEHSDEQSQK